MRPADLEALRQLASPWITRPAMTVEIRVDQLNALLDELEEYQDIALELRRMREVLRDMHEDTLRLHTLVERVRGGEAPRPRPSEGA
jgi:hypothetical protein